MSEYSPTGSVGYRNYLDLKELLEKNPVCDCGHTRRQHFVGGYISDCDKCQCQGFKEKE